MLRKALDICDRFGLLYYAVCGTALGAVKYGGFIPWDDDIDIALPKDDYETFLRVAPDLLPDNLFLQNYRTDPELPLSGSKIRDVNTTFIESFHKDKDICHGVFIDVFPLGGYPNDPAERKRFDRKRNRLENNRDARILFDRNLKYYVRYPRKGALHLLYRFGLLRPQNAETIRRIDELFSAYPTHASEIWCNYANSLSKIDYAPREQYGVGLWADFEGLRVRIPEKYDEYLTQKYGDWRADLPEDQKVGHHVTEITDLKQPYTNYVECLANGRIRIKDVNNHE